MGIVRDIFAIYELSRVFEIMKSPQLQNLKIGNKLRVIGNEDHFYLLSKGMIIIIVDIEYPNCFKFYSSDKKIDRSVKYYYYPEYFELLESKCPEYLK